MHQYQSSTQPQKEDTRLLRHPLPNPKSHPPHTPISLPQDPIFPFPPSLPYGQSQHCVSHTYKQAVTVGIPPTNQHCSKPGFFFIFDIFLVFCILSIFDIFLFAVWEQWCVRLVGSPGGPIRFGRPSRVVEFCKCIIY